MVYMPLASELLTAFTAVISYCCYPLDYFYFVLSECNGRPKASTKTEKQICCSVAKSVLRSAKYFFQKLKHGPDG